MNPGVQVSVPEVFPGPALKVAPGGRPDAVSEAIASPSGSAAVTFTVIRLFSSPEAPAGAVTTGAWSAGFTVTAVLAEPVSALLAVKVAVCAPMSPTPGVQVRVPEVFPGSAVKLAPAGNPESSSYTMASPSGSVALTVTVSSSSARTAAAAAAVTTGARSTLLTVMVVPAEPESALVAVNVTG